MEAARVGATGTWKLPLKQVGGETCSGEVHLGVVLPTPLEEAVPCNHEVGELPVVNAALGIRCQLLVAHLEDSADVEGNILHAALGLLKD